LQSSARLFVKLKALHLRTFNKLMHISPRMFHSKIACCLLFIGIVLSQSSTLAQFSPNPASPCAGSPVSFTNPAVTAGNNYLWDFCTGDLNQNPTGFLVNSAIPFVVRPEAMTMVTDGTNWYGFVTGRSNNRLMRINFGNTPNTLVTQLADYTDLGTLGGNLANPKGIRIVREGNNWVGLVVNVNAGTLVRINFGSNLANNSPTSDLITVSGIVANVTFPEHLDIKFDGTNYYAIVTGYDTGAFVVNFGSSIIGAPATIPLAQVNQSPSVAGSGFTAVRFFYDFGNWYAFGVGDSQIIYRITFATPTNPMSAMTMTPLPNGFAASGGFNDLEVVKDGSNYYLFIISPQGQLFKLDFGNSLTTPDGSVVQTTMGNFGVLGQLGAGGRPVSLCLAMARQNSDWYLFSVNRFTTPTPVNGLNNELVRLRFPNTCNASLAFSTAATPPPVSFLQGGNYTVSLDISNSNQLPINNFAQSIPVLNATVGDFAFNNLCLGQTTQFTNNSTGGDANVSSWLWNFGNGQTSNLKNPSLAYASQGTYTVSLTVNNLSGCTNTIQKTVQINASPTANFTVSGNCVNQITQFQSTSTLPNPLSVTYNWLVDVANGIGPGQAIANPTYVYPSVGTYTVSLTVIDALGCTSNTTRQVRVSNQPTANFNFSNACARVPLTFNDLSSINSGNIVAWQWTFSNLGTSTQRNPSFTFPNAGNYQVSLRATTDAGCSSTLTTQNVNVLNSLTSNFDLSANLGLAPLTVNFTNLTNGAAGFLWNFGNGQTSTTASPSITYTQPGTYQVRFQALNAQGCGTIATQAIQVVTVTDLNDLQANPEVLQVEQLYPNPAQEVVYCKINLPVRSQNLSLQVFTQNGQLINEQEWENLTAGEQTLAISVQQWQPGLYVMQFRQDGHVITKKVIVQ